MGRAQLADGLYNEAAGRAGTHQDAPPLPPLHTGSRLLFGITAALAAFATLGWVAVLLGVAGWFADLIWGYPPWSLLAYNGLALAVSGVIGYRYGRWVQPRGRAP